MGSPSLTLDISFCRLCLIFSRVAPTFADWNAWLSRLGMFSRHQRSLVGMAGLSSETLRGKKMAFLYYVSLDPAPVMRHEWWPTSVVVHCCRLGSLLTTTSTTPSCARTQTSSKRTWSARWAPPPPNRRHFAPNPHEELTRFSASDGEVFLWYLVRSFLLAPARCLYGLRGELRCSQRHRITLICFLLDSQSDLFLCAMLSTVIAFVARAGFSEGLSSWRDVGATCHGSRCGVRVRPLWLFWLNRFGTDSNTNQTHRASSCG